MRDSNSSPKAWLGDTWQEAGMRTKEGPDLPNFSISTENTAQDTDKTD